MTVYRATGGKVWNKFLGAPVAILTSIGHKSSEVRRTPLLYLENGETVVIVASKGGMSKPPIWMHNLRAHPDCEIQVGPKNRMMRAREATPEEEMDLWPKLIAIYATLNLCARSKRRARYSCFPVLEPRKS